MEKNKVILACVLIGVILVLGVVIFLNKDTMFRQEINITYPDHCVETYVNGKIVTPNCTNGRMMLEQKPILAGEEWSKVNMIN